MRVHACDYLKKLVEYSIMKIYAIATVVETKQTWADEDDFQVDKPSVKITVRFYIILKFLKTLLRAQTYGLMER